MQVKMEPHKNNFGFNASADLTENLRASLKTFVQLYDKHKDDLQKASKRFARAAAQTGVFEDWMAQALFTMFGGALGTVIGGVTGGIWGSLGAVGATTYARFRGNINAGGAVVGIVGSMLGGVVGGAFSGLIGGSAEVAVLSTGREVHGVVSDVLWFTVGFATGSAIGSTFGGSVGAAGGAVGGGFGALHAISATLYLAGIVTDLPKKNLKENQKQMEKIATVQQTGADFSESIKPLVDELKTVQKICDKMTSNETVKGVADQTVKTLTAVTEMEKSVSDSQREASWSERLSSVKEASSQCKKVRQELQRMRVEVEKLLGSL